MTNIRDSTPEESRTLSRSLQQLTRQELARRDVFGRTILHVLVLTNRYDLIRSIFKNPDIRILTTAVDYENGWNVLHYAIHHKRMACLKALLDVFRSSSSVNTTLYDLLRAKDRNKLTPLQLLGNNYKDLLWIPEYINEMDEYHFKFRYENQDNDDNKSENPSTKVRYRSHHDWWSDSRGASDIFVLGSNKNNSLGVGDSSDRSIPSRILHEYFKTHENDSIHDTLTSPRFRKMCLTKYSSVVLTQSGEVFTCGIGSRGRLGHPEMVNVFTFKKVEAFTSKVDNVVSSNYHSLALTSDNKLFSWGLNDFSQLGFSLQPFEPIPKEVFSGDLKKNSRPFQGIAVSKIHSVVYTKNYMYFWGLNIGQMGLNADKDVSHRVNNIVYKGLLQPQPRELMLREEIKLLETCETCTCVVTVSNDIHVYFQSQHIKLPRLPSKGSNSHFDHFKPSRLTEAPVVKKISMKAHTFIAVLLENGSVLSFSLSEDSKNVKYSSVWKAYDLDMTVVDMDVSYDGSIVLCTRNGLSFVKSTQSGQGLRKNSMSDTTLAIPITKNKFKKLENLNKVCRVVCDDSFSSFGFLKDDVDLIPLKLQKNDFFLDMEYLSPLRETNLYRKQDQLLDVDHDINSYVTDYFYPIPRKKNDDINHFFKELSFNNEEEDAEIESKDRLLKAYLNKHANCNKRPKAKSIFQAISDEDNTELVGLLKLKDSALAQKFASSDKDKACDTQIKFEHYPDISIGVHKDILRKRSHFCEQIFKTSSLNGDYFVDEGIEGRYDPDNNELIFATDVNIKAVLILIHFIYSNQVLAIWDDYPAGIHCPPDIKTVKFTFEKLVRMFAISDINGRLSKEGVYLNKMHLVFDNSGDVTVLLKDGEIKCHSSVLLARSAYFETIFSNRWDTLAEEDCDDEDEKLLNFEAVSVFQFRVLLNYLYGQNDLDVFNDYVQMIHSIADTDDFINDVLELIEIADELLVIQLKNLCQLVLKDLISIDNVLILLIHSVYLSCPKLFKNCCWFIYNNLEVMIVDGVFRDLDFDILKKLEGEFKIFQCCHRYEFVIGLKGEVNMSLLSNWFEDNSNDLLNDFLFNPVKYNQNFILQGQFEPLIDTRMETIRVEPKKKQRKSSSRQSIAGPTSDLFKFRTNNTSLGLDTQESAVEDDDFEQVVNRRRKSKTDPKTETNNPTLNQNPSNISLNKIPKSVEKAKPEKEPVPRRPSGVSPHSTWANKPVPVFDDKKTPLLGSAGGINEVKTKIKFAPKLPQKERRQLSLDLNTGSSTKVWDRPAAPSVARSSSLTNSLESLPVLGSTPSMTEIMIEESLKTEKDTEKKTLLEIQQEQEFARWWELEAARVQQQMKAGKKKPRPKKKSQNRADKS